MKLILIILCIFSITLCACTPTGHCTSKTNYIKVIDTLKPYKLVGKYCIDKIGDSVAKERISFVTLKVYDRRNANSIGDGVTFFYNKRDTFEFPIIAGISQARFPEGKYIISVSNIRTLGFSTKKCIEFLGAKKTIINIYLGSCRQW